MRNQNRWQYHLLCLFLIFWGSITFAGEWTYTKLESDGSSDGHADGTIDIVDYAYYDNQCRLIQVDYDENNDGTTDSIGYWEYNDADSIRTDTTDDDADGTIDSTTINSVNENGYPLKAEFYDANGNKTGIWYHTYDAGGTNCIKTEEDNDADGDIDSVTNRTFDENGNALTEETDSNNDGTIDSTTENTYTYDGKGSVLTKDTTMTVTTTSPINTLSVTESTQNNENTYDANGNLIQENGTISATMTYSIGGQTVTSAESSGDWISYYTYEYCNGTSGGSGSGASGISGIITNLLLNNSQ